MDETVVGAEDTGTVNEAHAVVPGQTDGSPNGPQAERQPTRYEVISNALRGFVVRGIFIYIFFSFFRNSSIPKNQLDKSGNSLPKQLPAFNLFENGTSFDLYVFLSEQEFPNGDESRQLIWEKRDLVYGDWSSGPNGDGTHTKQVEFAISKNVQNNGTLWMHTYLVHKAKSSNSDLSRPFSHEKIMTSPFVVYKKKMLIKHKKRYFQQTQNLITGKTATSPEDIEKAKTMKSEVVAHWHPNITINLLTDQTTWTYGSVPAPIDKYIEFTQNGDYYKPSVLFNEYWNLGRDYSIINETVKKLTLSVTYQPISIFKWQIYVTQANQASWNLNSLLGDEKDDDNDQDTLKEMLLETSPYLIAATFVVTILHSIFEFLAFKNDIQFWNNRKSLEGLSVRLVFFNVFQTLIVFLYILDNDANMMITISCFVSLLIEVWKINKVLDVSINRERKFFGVIPALTLKDKGSYVESNTKEYDELAFKYLSWALFPLLAGYAIYSLAYHEHKGWYSFTLNMLYGFLLTFGFIMMTPQLFINYKLKSVAHLPWRMMSYKCLNTFIDDVFAFIIKTPFLYRIGCLRDDVVFFIFLYQRWIYRTDHSRVNEFGISGEMEAERSATKNANPQDQISLPEVKSQEDKKLE